MMKRLPIYFLWMLVAALALLAGYYRFFWKGEPGRLTRVVDAPAVVWEVRQLQELATVRHSIQKVIGLEEEKVPFGSESVLMVVQAQVKAGVDLGELRASDVVVRGREEVVLRLPGAKILDVYVDDKQTRVYQRSKTWWTPWVAANPQLEQQARQVALEAAQGAAMRAGIVSNAQVNAELVVGTFLRSAGFRSVKFAGRQSQ